MTRRRVNGRFAKESGIEQTEASEGEAQRGGRGKDGELARAPRPAFCRVYTRERFAQALPEVTATLVRLAKKGSVPHLKLLVQICGLDKGNVAPERVQRPGRTLEQILMEEWNREQGTGGDEGQSHGCGDAGHATQVSVGNDTNQ